MQRYTDQRDADSADELWALEHPPVFTLGMNGRPEHLLAPGDIPVVAIDRGGQVFGLLEIECHRLVANDVEASFDGGLGEGGIDDDAGECLLRQGSTERRRDGNPSLAVNLIDKC